MSEEQATMEVEEVATEETPAVEEEAAVEYDVDRALADVLHTALIHDGLRRGLHECAKALTRRDARVALLAQDCEIEEYTKLIEALSNEGGIPLLKVETREKLGEWCGLCKIDQEGNARKVVGCSCAVVTEYGEDTDALKFLLEHIKNSK
eukprot:g4155.t1